MHKIEVTVSEKSFKLLQELSMEYDTDYADIVVTALRHMKETYIPPPQVVDSEDPNDYLEF